MASIEVVIAVVEVIVQVIVVYQLPVYVHIVEQLRLAG